MIECFDVALIIKSRAHITFHVVFNDIGVFHVAFGAQKKNMERDMMEKPKCRNCGAPLIKMLNVDRRENGGGSFIWVCGNVNTERVRDVFDYTHLEIRCTAKVKEQ